MSQTYPVLTTTAPDNLPSQTSSVMKLTVSILLTLFAIIKVANGAPSIELPDVVRGIHTLSVTRV